MYISDRKGNKTVPLKRISRIKPTMMNVGQLAGTGSSLWKIIYRDGNGAEQFTRIYPDSNNFEFFKETVKRNNRSVKILNWTYSLDLDQ